MICIIGCRPEILCIAESNRSIYHIVVLDTLRTSYMDRARIHPHSNQQHILKHEQRYLSKKLPRL